MARKSIEISYDTTDDLTGKPFGWFTREGAEDLALDGLAGSWADDDELLAALDARDVKYAGYHVELVYHDGSTVELR